jgi:formylglycine-generating enzyme required for sulfatase activity
MVVLPAGTFTMGSPDSEPGRYPDEGPRHDVRIAKPLAVGEFPITVDEFRAFVNATNYDAGSACDRWNGKSWESQPGHHSWIDPGFPQTGTHPAACLNWNDAQAYVKWLSGADKTGKAYRLLSEAEWEYAARDRTEPGNYPRYFFGDSDADFCKYGNGADQTAQKQIPGFKDALVLPCSDGYAYTSPVGTFVLNAFGLYDMAGNVSQWVEDCYSGNYKAAPLDGAAWTEGECNRRVVRGGSWDDTRGLLRAADRVERIPEHRSSDLGFRLARTLTP